MSGPGKNRDWGYASYYEGDDGDTHLIYTSYEKDGSVNRYTDNGDGGHGHSRWEDRDDYDHDEDPDWSRQESNESSNPDTGEVQDNGGCYLTTACMQHHKESFNDNCYELKVLRWFRDTMVPHEDIQDYYKYAPKIIEGINANQHKEQYYDFIYHKVVEDCVHAIEKKEFKFAYLRYKRSVQLLKNQFVSEDGMFNQINSQFENE